MKSQNFQTPEWVHNAVFYQVFPDRFARGKNSPAKRDLQPWGATPTYHNFMGGDLWGVIDKLDYLQELGITALYLNPIFQSASNHRYHTHDYYQVDPLLGGNAAFDALLVECKKRGVRVVLDGVFNHASRGFFQFNHVLEVGAESPYVHWFEILGYPMHAYDGTPNYRAWWGLAALPEFNFHNREVRDFILDVARYWLEKGIDGWRLDVAYEVEDDFWQEFRQVVKRTNPSAWIVGEVAREAQHWLQGDMFDGVMHYPVTGAMLNFFAGDTFNPAMFSRADIIEQKLVRWDAPAFAERIRHLLESYPWQATLAQMNLIDSHDMPRLLTIANGDESALRLAWLFLLTIPGSPCIYYGDEIGMAGGFDPDNRRCFDWNATNWNQPLRQYLQELICLRQLHPSLRTGQFAFQFAEGQVVIYQRTLGSESCLVVVNAGREGVQLPLPAVQAQLFGNARQHGDTWQLDARSGAVFLLE